jgi:hypothetical protein
MSIVARYLTMLFISVKIINPFIIIINFKLLTWKFKQPQAPLQKYWDESVNFSDLFNYQYVCISWTTHFECVVCLFQ